MAAANIIEMALIMMIECKYKENKRSARLGRRIFVENMKILKFYCRGESRQNPRVIFFIVLYR
jgi:hypothetical protein